MAVVLQKSAAFAVGSKPSSVSRARTVRVQVGVHCSKVSSGVLNCKLAVMEAAVLTIVLQTTAVVRL